MKKIYCIVMILCCAINYGQKLFIMKYVNENANISSYFSKVNTTNGSIISESGINANEAQTFTPGSPTYDSQSDVIYAAQGNRIFKYNANDFSDYTSFGGSINSLQPYDEIVLINNRLFAVRTYNTGSMYYEITLYELDKNNGSVLNMRAWTIWYGTNGSGIAFSSATNELFIVMGNNLSKYNIVTQELNVFNLPGLDLGTYYPGVIYAQNRLFVRKKDFTDNQVNNYIVEINKDTGAIIASNLLNPAIANYYYPRSQLAFLAQTNEIACLYYGNPSATNENIIVKYNIDTHTDSIISLPSENTTATRTEDYRSLVSVDSEDRLGVSQFQQNLETKIKAVYNLLGQKVPLETYNQVLIIEYENGQTVKKVNYKN